MRRPLGSDNGDQIYVSIARHAVDEADPSLPVRERLQIVVEHSEVPLILTVLRGQRNDGVPEVSG